MALKEKNMIDLEEEFDYVETEALEEEKNNAVDTYTYLDTELQTIISGIPYPHTGPYDTAMDYEDIYRVQYEKTQNKPWWKKRDDIKEYCDNGSLYSGHISLTNNNDYFVMDSPRLQTKVVHWRDKTVTLINADDKIYSHIVKAWRYPDQSGNVSFSRNIFMTNRHVNDVDVVLDRSNSLFESITDTYLRKALIRNKDKTGVQSIIQTIQEKQDVIRSVPKNNSFIVQGCAGSGKTMVLLHRLRYLLFNNEFLDDEYVFLVPGNGFKKYIGDISNKFNIKYKNIMPYQEYYQILMDRKPLEASDDKNELVFDSEYLSVIYSKDFLKECYQEYFDRINDAFNHLIDSCETKFNDIIIKEEKSVEENINSIKCSVVMQIEAITYKLIPFIKTKIDSDYSSVVRFVDELTDIYNNAKKFSNETSDANIDVEISADDERFTNDIKLKELQKLIYNEEILLNKASIFTERAHKNKLQQLKETYTQYYREIERRIIEEEKRRYLEKSAHMNLVFEDITLKEIEAMLMDVKKIFEVSKVMINEELEKQINMEEHLSEKFKAEIEILNCFIEDTADFKTKAYDCINNLKTSNGFVNEYIAKGTKLYSVFSKHISEGKEKSKWLEDFKLFSDRANHKQVVALNTMLFNVCKNKIKDRFDVKICDVYKHYWYLALYCRYLTRDIGKRELKYIFIDEAQDLSVSELELIYKYNSQESKDGNIHPIVNIFGDTNQTITEHGIRDWSNISFVNKKYILEDNFRNTNQIVSFCNDNLPFSMNMVGVDMDDVQKYKNINNLIYVPNISNREITFIVKDEYAVEDLKIALSSINNIDCQIYTVKMAKGLEFNEVFVIDRDMTVNEKYIAYTRALSKLNVIKYLPHVVDRSEKLIIQGEDMVEL